MNNNPLVDGNYYNKYQSKNPIARMMMAGFFEKLGFLLGQADCKSIYEAGCGEGYVTRFLSQSVKIGGGGGKFSHETTRRMRP